MRPALRGIVLGVVATSAVFIAACDRGRCITCDDDRDHRDRQPTPACTYAVSPTELRFPSQGGPGTVAVSTQSGCPWNAATAVAWVAITATGSGSVSLTVQVNTGAARTGTLTIAGYTVTVVQDGAPDRPTPSPTPPPPTPSCTYAVQESPQQFTYKGGSGGFSVSASRSDCPWNAAANVAWIAITGGSPGSGNGSVSYLVAGNAGGSRRGTISVAGKTVTVVQDAAP